MCVCVCVCAFLFGSIYTHICAFVGIYANVYLYTEFIIYIYVCI